MSTAELERLSLLSEVVEKVAGVAAGEVLPERSFIEDLGLDSLAMVAVVFTLEETIGVDISEEALAGVKTVQDLLELIS
ncbi:acyl carrier protein [Nonomuraea sp. 10N515B]|uniref:acyl carrier protein n=1 Tax=Nonomuraea sp. 10N515B TaxID=3457422 RepID=UPI003FCCD7A8